MTQASNYYIDEYENKHIPDKKLGEGGQGIVFRTKDPDLAIKIVTNAKGSPITDKNSMQRYVDRFKKLRLLPIDENINISLPLVSLKNQSGYVMQLLNEMVPFSNFWLDGNADATNADSKDIPQWLAKMPEKEARTIIHYYKTGGLRRRLYALYKCATILARLHSNGLVYGDISINNIFISQNTDDFSVWLIDADNIAYEISNGGSIVYTPKYGAPEIVQNKNGINTRSDCYSFAIVGFYLLSLIHPFIGKKLDVLDEDDWADEGTNDLNVEEMAYAGLLAWVDDKYDDSNSSNAGLPRSLILTKKLATLFDKTFSKGRENPLLRPTMHHWTYALAQAADTTVKCANCSMSYYYDFIHIETNSHNCPYCKTQRPQILVLESYQWNGNNQPLNLLCWTYVREISENSNLTIPNRVFDEFSMEDSDIDEIQISLSATSLLIKKTDHSKVSLSVANADINANTANQAQNKFIKLHSQIKLDFKAQKNTQNFEFWIFSKLNSARIIKCTIKGA